MKLREVIVLLVVVPAVVAGCQTEANRGATESVLTGTDGSSTRRMIDEQVVAGARGDASLYPVHFTGTRLNPLGEKKLELVTRGEGWEPLTVYLAGGTDSAEHRASIVEYLKTLGVGEGKIVLEGGANPAASSLARKGLENLSKTDTAPAQGQGGEESGWVAPSPASAGAAVQNAVGAVTGMK